MEKNVKFIEIGKMGSLDVKVPYVEIGHGNPVLSLITGIHGNEFTGLFVLNKLLDEIGSFDGTIRLFPSPNPLGQALQTRLLPRNYKDLNRIFPGHLDGYLPEIIAYNLMNILSSSDAVIDFHTFSLRNLLMAIFIDGGDDEEKRQNNDLINCFAPDLVWCITPKNLGKEKEYTGSLGALLTKENVPYFAVEISSAHKMIEQHIDRSVKGIINCMKYLSMIHKKTSFKEDIPRFKLTEYHAFDGGLFIPDAELMKEVKKGDILGELISLPQFKSQKILAKDKGTLVQIRTKTLVNVGDVLYMLGKKV